MKFLYCGDVVGRSGRDAIVARIPELRRTLDLDFVLVNGENAAAGFGITGKICEEFYAAGVDAIVLGNHSWDQRETIAYINGDPKLLRPLNYPKGTPGRGSAVFTTQKGQKVLVVQVMGRIFMDPLDDPFAAVEAELQKYRLGAGVDAIIVDIHGEATSEKMAMGHFCDGRVSLVCGTHSHVPTADAQILPNGTAYQTDAGMCGDYNSVIGMDKTEPLNRFVKRVPGGRFEPANGDATLCAVYVETDPRSGLATRIAPLRLGGRLQQATL
ncbi:MAG TPA: TIGR00282 family metallophosphoesterase [Ferrovibrio sp.]|uniref:TIGR00282 family metallophosphoesterase n=1 Tax=Ferrovibrio sp. TaxID=1917215 RepID=UPI002B4B20EF|nr:TIGR00282 family metallophosphoesterase [Ferrovibrio sp.]HLT77664.1 TIGR00282 family metallophosphoesterase [Ferrovibrio sp.]